MARHRTGAPGLTPYRLTVITIGSKPAARHLRRTARKIAGSQIALMLAALTTLTLLAMSAYQTASGAVALAGMFE